MSKRVWYGLESIHDARRLYLQRFINKYGMRPVLRHIERIQNAMTKCLEMASNPKGQR